MPYDKTYRFIADLLDTLDLAVCLFDDKDRTVLWNRTFLRFFPEHDGHVFRGEPYADNLRRFYEGRLSPEERPYLARYVAEGIARHRAQTRPFVFSHLGRRLRVASLKTPDNNRIRIWQDYPGDVTPTDAGHWGTFPIDLLDYIADGAMILDQDNRIIATNTEFRTLYDVPDAQSLSGTSLREVVRQCWSRAEPADPAAELAALDNLNFAGAPFELELPGGRWRRVIARRAPNGIGFFTHSDITLLKHQQMELERALTELSALAATDVLTGLANRRRFDAALAEQWARCAHEGRPIALMLIDLDHFKAVNDRFGHGTGDECLRRVATIVRAAAAHVPGAVAARYGGEEFSVVLPGATGEEAASVAMRMGRAMRAEHWSRVDEGLSALTVSIGICAAPNAGAGPAEAMERADAALYRAKNAGRDRIQIEQI